MKVKLTMRYVENVKPPKHGRLSIWDRSLPGFGLRISDKGRKSWVVMYRHEGRQCRMTIGTYPVFSLAEAREQARSVMRDVELGLDPRAQEEETTSPLLLDVIEQLIAIYARPRNRSWKEAERTLRVNAAPYLGNRPISEFSKLDISKVLDAHVARGVPMVGNRTLAHMRKLFNWCVDRGLLESSPANGVKAPAKEVARDRVLTDDEIKRVWKACDEECWPFGPLYKLLLLTGQRRGEAARMKWSDVREGIWTIPAEHSKNGRAHKVPLSPQAVEVLEGLPQIASQELVFSTNGRTPVSGFTVVKKRIDDLSGVSDWRVHDLRRTAASGMARLGVAPHVVEKILNHTSGTISGVAAVYNRYGYEEEKRDALCLWAAKLDILSSGERSDEVSQKSIDRNS